MSYDAAWWAAFGAIAQAIAAFATLLAVAISLWVVLSERAVRPRVTAGIRVQFIGDGTPGTYMVGIEVLNAGLRPFEVSSVGWRTGWLPRGPQALRYRYALQSTSLMLHQRAPPHIVEPGRNEGFYTKVADMKANSQDEARRELFQRRVPLLGFAPIWAMVNITGQRSAVAKADKELAKFLRTNDHASTTADT